LNGTPIAGATSSNYSKSNAQSADSGNYRVVAISAGGCKSDTSVSVLGAVIPAVNITSQPATATTVCQGSAYTVSVTAQNVTGYQWKKGGSNATNGAGATTSTYTINPVAVSDAGNYTVLLTGIGPCASVTSSTNVLSVTPLAAISTQPTAQTVCQGTTLSLSTSATNAASYQWLLNGTPIAGATSSNYSKSNAQSADSGNYRVVAISAGGCKSDTSAAKLGAVIPAVSILTQPPSLSFGCVGASFTIGISALNVASYTWFRNGTSTSQTNSVLNINPFTSADTGTYSVVMTGNAPCPSVTSTSTSAPQTNAAVIGTEPSPTDVCHGSNLTLTVNAQAAQTYQWKKNGVNIAGATGNTYSVSSVSHADSGIYSVVAIAFNGCINDTSTNVNVSIKNPINLITQPSTSTSLCEGARYTVGVSGQNILSYQWKKNGVNVSNGSGANSNLFEINPVSNSDPGSYSVLLSGIAPCPNVTSSANTLAVTPLAKITTQPRDTSLCRGNTLNLLVIATNSVGFQWILNGNAISGATSNPLVKSNIQLIDTGNYQLVAYSANACKSDTSIAAHLSVNIPLSFNSSLPKSTTYCEGQTVSMNTIVSGTGPYSYNWTQNGFPVGTNSNSYSKSNSAITDSGRYIITAHGNIACPSIKDSISIVINRSPVITVNPSGASPICLGDSLIMVANASNTSIIEWHKQGIGFTGATGTRYSLQSNLSDIGVYFVVAKPLPACASVNSSTLSIAIHTPPLITTNPISASILQYSSYTMNVVASGTGPFLYQWRKDGVNINGANSSSFAISSFIESIHQGCYDCIVSSLSPCNRSDTSICAMLTTSKCPSISKQPDSFIAICSPDLWSIQVNSIGAKSFQWYKDGNPITGAINPNYGFNVSDTTQSGSYKVQIIGYTTNCPSLFSNSVIVQVANGAKITLEPQSNSKCSPLSHTLTVSADNATNFQWFKNGQAISGAVNSSYTIMGLNASGDSYYVEAKNTKCATKAVSIPVNVKSIDPSTHIQLATKSLFDLEERCTDDKGWTYYAPVVQSDELVFAVKKNGNLVVAKPDIEILGNYREISPINVENHGAILGSRMFNLDFQSQIKKAYEVKFYYSQAEEDAIINRFKEIRTFFGSSFKTNRTDTIHFILSTQTPFTSSLRNNLVIPLNIENAIAQVEREFGVENGVKFVILKSLVSTRSGGTMFMDYTLASKSSINASSIGELEFSIYPVPTLDGKITVNIQSHQMKPIQFTITDMMGRIVAKFKENHRTKESSHVLDLSNLSNGNYQLQIDNTVVSLSSKFTIAK
jgi:hypothetical protein